MQRIACVDPLENLVVPVAGSVSPANVHNYCSVRACASVCLQMASRKKAQCKPKVLKQPGTKQ